MPPKASASATAKARALAYIYFEDTTGRRMAMSRLTNVADRDHIAKQPELLRKPSDPISRFRSVEEARESQALAETVANDPLRTPIVCRCDKSCDRRRDRPDRNSSGG